MRIVVARTPGTRRACFDIRRAVFIEEQSIPEAEEWDDADATATHFLAAGDDGPAATARLIADGATAKIGRVAVMRAHRGTGLGLRLMAHVLDHARAQGFAVAALDSQTYAIPFYARLGFAAEGPEFDDGSGILHRRMHLDLLAASPPVKANRGR
jgi:predicted GNAT family N-acyltransferase